MAGFVTVRAVCFICGKKDKVQATDRTGGLIYFREKGWRYNKNRGWICPDHSKTILPHDIEHLSRCLEGWYICQECDNPSEGAIDDSGGYFPVCVKHGKVREKRDLRVIWQLDTEEAAVEKTSNSSGEKSQSGNQGTIKESTREELIQQQLDEIAERLAAELLALAGAKSQPAQIVYNNLVELLTVTLGKIEKDMADKDEYPYTFELFTDELESRLHHWFDPQGKS